MQEKDNSLISDSVSEQIIRITEELATKDGAHTVTVRRILEKLGTTNRVFYNRFHNVDEVLQIVYKNAVLKMHESVETEYDISKDFFEYVIDVATSVLVKTYEIKMQFSQYMFEHDSLTDFNREWWTKKIHDILDFGTSHNLIKKVDYDTISYAAWCFCRGFNADALSRKIPIEEAVVYFKAGFGCFLDGLRLEQK
ncbi:MAG: TetR/AcrR family transcriptional regulator [Clostridia bacterium]|nr:TetR/AcrR family transcriptional regulator [Clostridia bacterium]